MSQLIAYKHWMIWICEVTSKWMYQVNVVVVKFKVADNVNYSSKLPQNCTEEQYFSDFDLGFFHQMLFLTQRL